MPHKESTAKLAYMDEYRKSHPNDAEYMRAYRLNNLFNMSVEEGLD